MSALNAAMHAYVEAVEDDAPSIILADRVQDIINNGPADMSRHFLDRAIADIADTYEREQALERMIADPEGQALVARIHTRKDAA